MAEIPELTEEQLARAIPARVRKRLMQGQLLAKIAAAVGNGVVKSLKITGPATPSWRKGPRHIAGRGPRDTYG